MVVLSQSQTYPINPPGVEPVLNVEQVWKVLTFKSRNPELFLKPVSSSKILEENESNLTRELYFEEGMGPPAGKVVEQVFFKKPWKVDYKGEGNNGAFISNIISQGEDHKNLYLTFYFEWTYPDMEEDSEEAEKTAQSLWDLAKGSVMDTIDVARKMIKEGEA